MSADAKGEAKGEKREDADGDARLEQGTLLDPLQKLGNSEMFGGNGAGEQKGGEMKVPEPNIQVDEKKEDSARDGEKKKKRHHRHKGKEDEA